MNAYMILGVLVLAVTMGDAQAESTSEQPAVTGAPSSGLEEIVVTAQRRSESLEKAGLAINAVTGDTLERAGVSNVQALTNLVPALQISTGGGPYSLFYLRGVGNFSVNPLSDSAISFNLDGVPINRPSSTAGVFYDLGRVEVLKGPQGTLYGRNATGGAINVITREPTLNQTEGYLNSDFGNYDSRKFDGALNLPLGEIAAARVAFATSDHHGYLSDGTDDDKSAAGRVRFLIEPASDLTLKFGGDYYHQGGRGGGSALVSAGYSANQRVGISDPRAQAAFENTLYFPAGSTLPGLPNYAHADNAYWGLNAELDWRNELGTLTVLPALRHTSLNYVTPDPGLYVTERTVSKDSSIEARFASNEDQALRWLVGAYYLNEKSDTHLSYNSGYNFFDEPSLSLPVTSAAAFGRLTYAITDTFRLTGGVRYTRDHKSIDATASSANILCFAAFPSPTNPFGTPFACPGAPGFPYFSVPPEVAQSAALGGAPIPYGNAGNVISTTSVAPNLSQTFSKTTWRAAAEWDVAAHSLLYASVETGFKSGGFFVADIDPVYKPETITAYTLGSKNRFLDNRLQLNAEVFYWRYKDQQYSHITQQSNGAIAFATENVGRSTIKGVEADSLFAVTDKTLVGADIQYLKATYDQFQFQVPVLLGLPVANCPYQQAAAYYSVNCSGRAAPESPTWTLTLNGEQKVPLGAAGELVLDVSTKYQTSTFVGIEFLESEHQSSYWMSNAQLTFNPTAGHWSVGAYVNNIEDATVKNDAFPQTLVGGALVASFVRPPRTYGVRAGIQF